MAGIDMIGRLADVENRAEEMLLEAQSEGRGLVAKAREQGESRYNTRCDEVMTSAQERLATANESVKKGCDDALESYRSSVTSSRLDVESFNMLLDKTLFN